MNADTDRARDALRAIPPDCDRETWVANEFGVDTTQAQDLNGAALDEWLVQAEDELTARLMEGSTDGANASTAPAAPGQDAAKLVAMQSLGLVARILLRLHAERHRLAANWANADIETGIAIDLAAAEVQRLRASPPDDLQDLEVSWYRVAAVVTLASRAGPSSFYGRVLAGLTAQMENLPELWEHVGMEGEHGT